MLEQAGFGIVDAAHRIVIEDEASDTAVLGQSPRLWADLLGGEHAFYGREQGVPVEELEVAGELLHTVDLPAAFDLHRDVARTCPGEDVDRADGGRVFAAYQGMPISEEPDLFGEEFLQVSLDAVLDQPGVVAEFETVVSVDLEEPDPQLAFDLE